MISLSPLRPNSLQKKPTNDLQTHLPEPRLLLTLDLFATKYVLANKRTNTMGHSNTTATHRGLDLLKLRNVLPAAPLDRTRPASLDAQEMDQQVALPPLARVRY